MQTTSKHITIRRRFGQNPRRRRNAKNKITLRPPVSAGHGFLKHHFLPVWDSWPLQGGQHEIETAFYQSLSYLEALYKFKTPRSRPRIFPFNIAADFEAARQSLEKIDPSLTLFINLDEQQKLCLNTAKPYNTAATLFYIPVKPLSILRKNKRKTATADLLLSVFSYLHLVLDVPYYRGESSFLNTCYQVMKEQFDQYEDEGEEIDSDILKKFKELETVGDKLLKKINDPFQLQQLEKRVKKFVPTDKLDREILGAAKSILKIYRQFPDQTIFDHIPENLLHPEESDRITADQYISFYWSDENGYISDWIFEYVNGCFENCGAIDEPVNYQVFDSPQKEPAHDLSFATAVFDTIENLCTVLNDIK